MISGVTTTDANGRTLPCEVMLETSARHLLEPR